MHSILHLTRIKKKEKNINIALPHASYTHFINPSIIKLSLITMQSSTFHFEPLRQPCAKLCLQTLLPIPLCISSHAPPQHVTPTCTSTKCPNLRLDSATPLNAPTSISVQKTPSTSHHASKLHHIFMAPRHRKRQANKWQCRQGTRCSCTCPSARRNVQRRRKPTSKQWRRRES